MGQGNQVGHATCTYKCMVVQSCCVPAFGEDSLAHSKIQNHLLLFTQSTSASSRLVTVGQIQASHSGLRFCQFCGAMQWLNYTSLIVCVALTHETGAALPACAVQPDKAPPRVYKLQYKEQSDRDLWFW